MNQVPIELNAAQALGTEVLCTFQLVLTVFSVEDQRRRESPEPGNLAIGLAHTAGVLIGVIWTLIYSSLSLILPWVTLSNCTMVLQLHTAALLPDGMLHLWSYIICYYIRQQRAVLVLFLIMQMLLRVKYIYTYWNKWEMCLNTCIALCSCCCGQVDGIKSEKDSPMTWIIFIKLLHKKVQ